jgi:hypothetical protein
MDKACIETVRSLLEAMPAIVHALAFAMKDGTATAHFCRLGFDWDFAEDLSHSPRGCCSYMERMQL